MVGAQVSFADRQGVLKQASGVRKARSTVYVPSPDIEQGGSG
jgi:hypothetical protein